MIGEDGIEQTTSLHFEIWGSWIDWSQSTLKVFEGMTLEVFHVGAIPPASTGEAKQSGKVRHLSLWSHQICVDALHYHCFPSEAMTTHCFHHFSITVQIGLRWDVANTWKALLLCILLWAPGSRPSWRYYLPPVEMWQNIWLALHTSSSAVLVPKA